jgi:hypothetical protein
MGEGVAAAAVVANILSLFLNASSVVPSPVRRERVRVRAFCCRSARPEHALTPSNAHIVKIARLLYSRPVQFPPQVRGRLEPASNDSKSLAAASA